MYLRKALSLTIVVAILLSLLPIVTLAQEPAAVPAVAVDVDPFIYEEMANSPDGQAEFFVAFDDTTDLTPAYSMGWSARGHFVVEALQATAEASQVNVKAWLEARGIEYTSFWVNNTIVVRADEAILNELATFPEVSGFRGNHVYEILPDEAPAGEGGAPTAPAYPWNITYPMADQVHSGLGIKGQGMVLGGMDTGAEYDHIGLVNNYRGNLGGGNFDHTYSWSDPTNACGGTPCDTHGHGTSTMGIMAGDDDPSLPDGAWIGMAPDAEWIHCLGCPSGSCPSTATTACAQWFLAPGGDPDMRPTVVNHSWGTWSPNDCNGNAFQAELMAYRAADIVPAFAAGNVGDACNSSTSPANNTDPAGNPIAFASGAHLSNGALASYSSCGWNACNPTQLFPDVASPSSGSCTTGLNDTYNCDFGGTSAASPHTAGCVALVRQANPSLTVDQVEQVIRDAANDVDDTSCGGTIDWNNRFGEGYLDCYEAVQMAGTGAIGTIDGYVLDDGTGDPIEDAEITATLGPTQTWQANTDDTGYYAMTVMTGTFEVEASKEGYFPETVMGVDVFSDTTTTVNFDLVPTGILSFVPTPLEATLALGASTVVNATLYNDGAGAAYFEIREIDGGYSPSTLNLPVYVFPTIRAEPYGGDSYSGGGYQLPDDSGGIDVPPAPKRYTGPDALVYYSDRATFDADHPGLPVEGFENTLVPDGSIVACDGPFDSSTDNACFAPGGILDGIRLMNTVPTNQMVVIGDGALGQPSALVGPNTFTDDHDITFFNGDVYAVGFDLWAPLGAATFDIYIYGPGDVLLGQTSVLAATTGTFWGVYSDDPITRIRTESAAGDGELFDDIAFGGSAPDVPWLGEDPITGTVPASDSMAIDITFDAGVPEVTLPGEYYATLQIINDTPYGDLYVPVTMTVLEGGDLGLLEGYVYGTGYCDGEMNPVETDIFFENSAGMTWTVTSASDGYYARWLEEDTYTVTASYVDHLDAVEVVDVIEGMTTTQDLALRLIESCMDYEPQAFTVTLTPDTQFTDQLTIYNDGAGELTWELRETFTMPMMLLNEDVVVNVPAIKARPDIASRSESSDQPARQFEMHIDWVILQPIDVLLVTPDVVGGGDISLLLTTLAAFPDLNVTVWDGNAGTPSVPDMQAYDVVFVGNDILWTSSAIDKTVLSDNLADYIDAGGKVLAGSFIWSYDDWGLGGGRFITDDYSPYEIASQDFWLAASLGTYDAGHPIMAGITNVTDNFNHQDPALSSTGTWVASWDDGENFVAVSPGCVGLNQEYFQGADFGGQTGELLHNALLYLVEGGEEWVDVPWVSEVPTNGLIMGDDMFDVDVIFDSTGMSAGECYTAALGLLHDDPGVESPSFIPLEMCVVQCVEVSDVDLTLVTTGTIYAGDQVDFSADIMPDNANKPYSYTIDYGDGMTPTVGTSSDDPLDFNYTYVDTGTFTVEIAVWNCEMGEPVVDTVDVVVEQPPCVDVEDVALTVVTTGTIYTGDMVDLSGDIMPDNFGAPYNYSIDFGDGVTPTVGTSSDDPLLFSYTYVDTGTYTVEIAVWNCEMTTPVTDTVEVDVMEREEPQFYIYLPVVLKNNE